MLWKSTERYGLEEQHQNNIEMNIYISDIVQITNYFPSNDVHNFMPQYDSQKYVCTKTHCIYG